VNQDITGRKQAEEQLRESEERFRKIFEESRIGIVLVDSNQAYLAVNKAFCSMVGYSHEELMSLSYGAISHPDNLEENVRNAWALWRGEIPHYKTEKRYIHKSGKIVSVDPIFKSAALPALQSDEHNHTVAPVPVE